MLGGPSKGPPPSKALISSNRSDFLLSFCGDKGEVLGAGEQQRAGGPLLQAVRQRGPLLSSSPYVFGTAPGVGAPPGWGVIWGPPPSLRDTALLACRSGGPLRYPGLPLRRAPPPPYLRICWGGPSLGDGGMGERGSEGGGGRGRAVAAAPANERVVESEPAVSKT
ncbi:hypothetical protein ACSSS7_000914 [Eimeria intestinalis]